MIVEPYNPEWPHMFHQLQTFLYRNLVGTYHAIEHVGSTAVPGMAAKPIIDIDIVARDGKFEQIKNRLIAAGYEYQGDQGVPGRESFRMKDPGLSKALPEHHLYVCAADSEELRRHRAFRDFLIAHPEWVEKVNAEERELASRSGGHGYEEAMEPTMREIMVLALAEAPA